MADANTTPRSAPIVVRVDDDLKADVDRCAARRGLSRNKFVAQGLRRLVEGEDARYGAPTTSALDDVVSGRQTAIARHTQGGSNGRTP